MDSKPYIQDIFRDIDKNFINNLFTVLTYNYFHGILLLFSRMPLSI